MASRNYSDPTLKRLFSLSGNQCVFPNCEQENVLQNKTIVAEICHIEGLESSAPRYNPNLKEKESNDYPNLILLCPTHHTIIDKDEKTYSVENLKKIKKEQEDKFLDKPFLVEEDLMDNLKKVFSVGIQVFGEVSNQIIAPGNTVNIITTPGQAGKLIQTLFEDNFPKLRQIAQETAMENIRKFENTFVEKLKTSLKEHDIKQLSDPDIQYILTQAVLQAGRTNENDLRENLSNLMVERIKNSDNSLRKLAYNESIETIGKITPDGMKIIALCFIARYARWDGVKTIEILNKKIDTIAPLFDFKNTNAEFQHIVYTGCGELGIGSWNYVNNIREIYNEIMPLVTANEPLESFNLPQEIMEDLFIKINDKEYGYKIINQNNFNEYLDSTSISEPTKNSLKTLFSQAVTNSNKKILELATNSKQVQLLHSLIRDSNLTHLTLTSVGIVIGAMYYEKISGKKININIWIN